MGQTHIETARHYLTSEAFLGQAAKGFRSKGKKLFIQTKVRPYTEAKAFKNTVRSCLKTLQLPSVELLAIHGVNLPEHVDTCVNTVIDAAQQVKDEKLAQSIGFSFHVGTNDAVRLIDTGRLDFVNLHFNFFGSYTNPNNARAVAAAERQGMGVMSISPVGQAGDLHKPSGEWKGVWSSVRLVSSWPNSPTCSLYPICLQRNYWSCVPRCILSSSIFCTYSRILESTRSARRLRSRGK